ncbi:Cyanophycinase [Novipirellula aureliae]|uniref:Cyanophycinase n=1 Tax=Novipirellula aureliae TaxID=2527966 RepID=A0A5C6DUU4_9BACT|nr:Type 1 glutamine amidotransferase-like domain-containing protein [Novipirellula aureliae]TWU38836.1 Cyanophycinase [Novipirellula aureliae]
MKSILIPLAFFLAMAVPCIAQVFDEKFEHWPQDLKINGRIVVAGNLEDAAVLTSLVSESDRQKKTAVVLAPSTDAMKTSFTELFAESEELEFPDVPKTIEEIESLLREYDVVVWHSAEPLGKKIASEIREANGAFHHFIDDGNLLVALGGVAEIVAQAYFESDDGSPPALEGLNLLPDCILETDFDGSADQARLLTILAAKKHSVGIGLDKHTALVLSGRKIRVAGTGKATFVLKGNDREPSRVRSITVANRRSRDPENALLDLTQWRRDAIDRTLPPFPAEQPREPSVKNGTLIIVGGGGSPRGLMDQFIRLAGGVKNAKLVYVPCSEQDDVGNQQGMVQSWKRAGVKDATFIHTKDRNQANSDDEFLEPLRDATGIYFGGGRQWNFADSYYGTAAHRLMKEVLDRGGVIAGSSAGASIQARYLARATPIGNSKIMAFGYERGGLGFLDGVAIDQHFTQRNRYQDMTALVERYPQLLGIGIDESTAILVQKSIAQVIGRGKVHFYDRNQPVTPGKPDFVALPAGSEYDLLKRQVVKDTTRRSPDDK